MCRYAFKIMGLFRSQVNLLALALGPDTAELDLRAGLHTGQVTAGVLRGDRARFSLFGDTVNTTARMESTSNAGMIQLSKEAADELLRFDRELWIKPRADNVLAKGKGILDTFWLVAIDDEETTKRTDDAGDVFKPTPATLQLSTSNSESRLIKWNVKLLVGLMKRIVAFRQKVKSPGGKVSLQGVFELRKGHTYLEEVQEIIELPQHQIDAKAISEEDVVLPDCVLQELELLVSTIAQLYNNNPFHNFEVSCSLKFL